MIIKEISIKNFKSFGNSEQIFKLNNNGELILLSGNNGNGTSTLISSFDYSLYGKVKGNKKKWAVASSLVNRINNSDLLVGIKFNSNGVDVEIKRGISPNKLELYENGVFNDKAGKTNIDDKIENYIGLDIETFKSFISMSINDFKNFISLTNEEKKLLLDKLFNLEVINVLNDILKDIIKNNKQSIILIDNDIKTLDESIFSINESIEKYRKKSIEKQKQNIEDEINDIVKEINDNKQLYLDLKDKVKKINDKKDILDKNIDDSKKQYLSLNNELKNTQKEIDLYNSGKCPLCSTDFHTELHNDLKNTLIDKKSKLESLISAIDIDIKELRDKQIKLKEISDTTNISFNNINFLLKSKKEKLDSLKLKNSEKIDDSLDISEFKKTIDDLNLKKEKNKESSSIFKEKDLYYKELNRIFGENGVKKSIISSIIKPINHFISENIKKMNLPFEVKLDETFNADIKSFGSQIDFDSLSTGETKLINICILVAYLKLIRNKKLINVLFLDEVFSSIDVNNINNILVLLKSFANEYNINIFVVHHAILNQDMFDRIISIEKNIFTEIKEIQ